MTWQSVGTHTFVPTDKAVEVGSFDLAAGQDTIWVKITQLNDPADWPFSYGILSWRNANGTPLGSIKAYSNRLGEVFRLGNGLPPSDGVGSIWFEPRGFNLGWLKAGFPWELQFEAQSGGGTMSSGYWNRDPVNGVLSPVTAGDDVDLGIGDLIANNCNFTYSENKSSGLFNWEGIRAGGQSALAVGQGGNPGVTAFLVRGSGNCENLGNNYGALSDARTKSNIRAAGSQWDDIKNIEVVHYSPDHAPSETHIGVVAQQVEQVSPGLVTESELDGQLRKSVAYSVLFMKAVGALQEAMQRIELLEAEVTVRKSS